MISAKSETWDHVSFQSAWTPVMGNSSGCVFCFSTDLFAIKLCGFLTLGDVSSEVLELP